MVACLLGVAATAIAQPAPLNSSVLIFDEVTLDRAPAIIDRAAEVGNRRVLVCVTVHCRLTPELRVVEYGLVRDRRLQWKAPKHPDNFLPIDDERRRWLSARLTAVFRRAVEHGMDLALLPHLDAYGDVVEWRNHFDFDPLAKHRGASYASALLLPIIDALDTAVSRSTRVQLSLSGEMGRSLFAHAERYRQVADLARRRLGQHRVEVGVSLNHNDVAGGHSINSRQRAAVQRLIDDCDFVGFSHYRPFTPPARVEHFTVACDAFIAALAKHGVTLPATAPLHFSEVALGGAPPRRGAATPQLAAAEPWEGTGDPRQAPWRTAEMQTLRRDYHAALLRFLATQPGPRRVANAYLWSEGSWDPQGIDSRAFMSDEVVRLILEHNLLVDRSRAP